MSAISIPNMPALVSSPVASEVLQGLTAQPKTLSPWLFYDEAGSRLFEEITELPEYYVTRTERNILAQHADEIVAAAAGGRLLSVTELGAGKVLAGLIKRIAEGVSASSIGAPADIAAFATEQNA